MWRRLVWPVLVVAVAATAIFLFWQNRKPQVETAQARFGPAVELVYATGFVEPDQPVSVASRLTAPVLEVLVDEGARVTRGQPLVLLDNQEQRGLLAQNAAQRRKADADEVRVQALYRKGWVTRARLDEVVMAADAARAAERSASARVDQLVVRAGIDGTVLKRDVYPGDLAVPTRVLMTLGDPGRIRVTATVDERDIPLLRVGQAAFLRSDAWPGQAIRGHVRELTPGGDPNQRAFRARIAIDDTRPMPIGMSLEVNIRTRSVDRALLVPQSAIDAGAVWVVEDKKVHRRPVRTGIVGQEKTQILSGLKEGETVIVAPQGLSDGDRVKIKETPRQ